MKKKEYKKKQNVRTLSNYDGGGGGGNQAKGNTMSHNQRDPLQYGKLDILE